MADPPGRWGGLSVSPEKASATAPAAYPSGPEAPCTPFTPISPGLWADKDERWTQAQYSSRTPRAAAGSPMGGIFGPDGGGPTRVGPEGGAPAGGELAGAGGAEPAAGEGEEEEEEEEALPTKPALREEIDEIGTELEALRAVKTVPLLCIVFPLSLRLRQCLCLALRSRCLHG